MPPDAPHAPIVQSWADAKPWYVQGYGVEPRDFMTFAEAEGYARSLARNGARAFIEGPSGSTYATVVTDALGRVWTDLTGEKP